MAFENICLQKHYWVFELRQFSLIFRSICSSVSVNTGHNPSPVNYNLIFIMVLASNLLSVLLLLLLGDFIKYLRLFCICTFYRIFVFFLIFNKNRRSHWL